MKDWHEASHYMVANSARVNCAIIDGRPAKTWYDIPYRDKEGELKNKRTWYEGVAHVMLDLTPEDGLGAKFVVVYDKEETDEGIDYKYIFNAESGSMFVDVLSARGR